jgi:hypothetical protein
VCGETSDALDLMAVVGLGVAGVAAAVVLGALAEVNATRELADDVEVDATADFSFERRAVDEGVRGEEAGAKVAVCAHFLAESQDSLLRTHGAGAPFGTANGSEKNGIGGFGCCESLVGQGRPGCVD